MPENPILKAKERQYPILHTEETPLPGGQLYRQNIELLQDQFVYGSAFPFGNIDTILRTTPTLPLSDKVMEKYFYLKAKRLLDI